MRSQKERITFLGNSSGIGLFEAVRAVRLVIDGGRVAVLSSDDYGYFARRLMLTPSQPRLG
jgi:hypothetical protein